MNMAALPGTLWPQSAAPWADRAPVLARACSLAPMEKLPEGLDAFFHGLQGHWLRWRSAQLPLAKQAQAALKACTALDGVSPQDLHARVQQAGVCMRLDPQQAKGQLIEVLATIGQVAWRELGLKPYAVQFMGAMAIHRGLLAEMATGEGKTLTVGMAGVLAGLSGRACHVITANDYLAQRDAEKLTPLYRGCGLTVASVFGELDAQDRPTRYAADVVYLTAKELLADHLKDQLGPGTPEHLNQQAFGHWLHPERTAAADGRFLVRGLHTAIVDEADSILIDEAVTPLILSAPRASSGLSEAVLLVSALADTLQEGPDYTVTLQSQSITLLASARERLTSQAESLADLWRPAPRREELLRQALMVRHFHKPGQHYVVQDGEVVLLDEFTGRMTPGRTLTAGLHQAIEAREGLTITAPNESLAQMSFQAFFRCFRKLSGSTGTAWEAASELWRVYGLQVVRIPTHRPRQTIYHAPVLVEQSAHKWAAVVQEVLAERAKGRPVLVGVRSITSSQLLAEHLQAAQCPVSVLNALAHAQEADIVAQAGAPGRVTIATNMAGRGTDIGLGQGVAEAGGLHVIVAESNDSARIDRQLAGRCGRQGDPGSVSVYLCLADELVQRLMSQGLRRLVLMVSSRQGAGRRVSARPSLGSRVAAWAFRRVQKRAERQAFLRRWSVLRSDDWMASALPFGGRRKGGPA